MVSYILEYLIKSFVCMGYVCVMRNEFLVSATAFVFGVRGFECMLSLFSGSSGVLFILLLVERYLLFFADEAEDSVRLLLSRGMIECESRGAYEALDAVRDVGEAYCVVHAVAVEDDEEGLAFLFGCGGIGGEGIEDGGYLLSVSRLYFPFPAVEFREEGTELLLCHVIRCYDVYQRKQKEQHQ